MEWHSEEEGETTGGDETVCETGVEVEEDGGERKERGPSVGRGERELKCRRFLEDDLESVFS